MKFRTIIIILIVSISIAAFFERREILLSIGDYLIISDNLQPSDIIHVIAGEDHRADYAITLYKEGYGKKLFFTGGWCKDHMEYHGKREKQRAISKGVSPNVIAFDDSKVNSTYAEAMLLKKHIDHLETHTSSVIVVSDPYHMRRVRWTHRNILGDSIAIYMAPVPFNLSPYKRIWWKNEKDRTFVKDEYLKILYYYARYKYSRGSLKDWLASLDNA